MIFACFRLFHLYIYNNASLSIWFLLFCVIFSVKTQGFHILSVMNRKIVKTGLGKYYIEYAPMGYWEDPYEINFHTISLKNNITRIIQLISRKMTLVIMYPLIFIRLLTLQEPKLYLLLNFSVFLSIIIINKNFIIITSIMTIILVYATNIILLADEKFSILFKNIHSWIRLNCKNQMLSAFSKTNLQIIMCIIIRKLDFSLIDYGLIFLDNQAEKLNLKIFEHIENLKINKKNKYWDYFWFFLLFLQFTII